MDFNDPMLEHLIDQITNALKENDREEAAKYMDIVIEKYPEVANILMQSIEFNNIMAENEEEIIKQAEQMPFEDNVQEDVNSIPFNENNESLNDEEEDSNLNEEQIITDMNSMLDIEPQTVEEYIQKGTVLTITENFDEAIKCFDEAIAMDPENISALISKANTLDIMENEEEAEKVYEIVMNTNPEDIYDMMSKGYVLETHNRYEDAINCYDEALAKDPENINVLFLKGSCLIAVQKYEEALSYLDKTIKSFENENEVNLMFELPSAYHNKGIALDKIGKEKGSLKAFNMALKLNPDYFPSYYEIGLIEEEKENYNDAIINFNKFLKYDPENEEVLKAKERVEKLIN